MHIQVSKLTYLLITSGSGARAENPSPPLNKPPISTAPLCRLHITPPPPTCQSTNLSTLTSQPRFLISEYQIPAPHLPLAYAFLFQVLKTTRCFKLFLHGLRSLAWIDVGSTSLYMLPSFRTHCHCPLNDSPATQALFPGAQ